MKWKHRKKRFLAALRRAVDADLKKALRSAKETPSFLYRSMAYSVFAGGKRLRPLLCLASAELVGLPKTSALRAASALELIHTYSLIHDDLPCMDDDALRRGRPTNHKVFGEAGALLAGDALQALAFAWLSDPGGHPPAVRRNLGAAVRLLARAAGPEGMVGGQVLDWKAEGKRPTRARVRDIHRKKTGALLCAAVTLPGVLKGISRGVFQRLEKFGLLVGEAFQIVDDILNVTSDAKTLGKSAGSDAQRGKMTYPAVFGLEPSRRKAEVLLQNALRVLQPFGKRAVFLVELARLAVDRKR